MLRRFIVAAVVFVLGVPPALAAPTPQQFTAEIADRIAKAAPALKVSIEGPLTLKLIGGANGEAQTNLDRIAAFCATASPDGCEASKARFVRGTVDMATNKYAPTRANLRVVVRSAEYGAAMQQVMDKSDRKLFVRPIGDGLVAMLAADFPDTTMMVSDADLEPLGLTGDEAFALGRSNVLATLPPLPGTAEIEGKVIAIADHDYDSSLLLADGWRQLAEQTGGKLFVTVANATLIVIGTAEDDDAVHRLRPAVEADFRAAERGISPEVYRWTEAGWRAVK
jgi:hypothetical protein